MYIFKQCVCICIIHVYYVLYIYKFDLGEKNSVKNCIIFWYDRKLVSIGLTKMSDPCLLFRIKLIFL